MDGHGGSSAGSYLTDPTSPIPSHCASIVVTSTLRVNFMTIYNTEMTHQKLRKLSLMYIFIEIKNSHNYIHTVSQQFQLSSFEFYN